VQGRWGRCDSQNVAARVARSIRTSAETCGRCLTNLPRCRKGPPWGAGTPVRLILVFAGSQPDRIPGTGGFRRSHQREAFWRQEALGVAGSCAVRISPPFVLSPRKPRLVWRSSPQPSIESAIGCIDVAAARSSFATALDDFDLWSLITLIVAATCSATDLAQRYSDSPQCLARVVLM